MGKTIKIKKAFLKYIYLIPPIQILLTLSLCFIEVDAYLAVVLGNSVGYSILTSFIYLVEFIISDKKYCIFTKTSALGVLGLSVFNFIGAFYSEYANYEKDLTILTFSITLILTLLLYLRKYGTNYRTM
jgi:hypothetical protein